MSLIPSQFMIPTNGPFCLGFELAARPNAKELVVMPPVPSNYRKQEVIDEWAKTKAAALQAEAATCPIAGFVLDVYVFGMDANKTVRYHEPSDLVYLYLSLCSLWTQHGVAGLAYCYAPTKRMRQLYTTVRDYDSGVTPPPAEMMQALSLRDPVSIIMGSSTDENFNTICRFIKSLGISEPGNVCQSGVAQVDAIKDIVNYYNL